MTTRRARLRRLLRPVRAKVLVAVVSATALGLVLSGVVSYVVQVKATERRVDAAIAQEIQELRNLATSPNPSTNEAWTSLDALLFARISTDAADENQSSYAVVRGGNTYVPISPQAFDLRDEPDVNRLVNSLTPDSPITSITAATAAGRTLVTAVPVRFTPDAETTDPAVATFGVFVVGHSLDAEFATVRSNALTYAFVATGSVLFVAAVAWLVVVRLLRPLDALHETATGVGAEELSHRVPVHGDDDVADLARGFNAMLERLELSFDTQRQFMDDLGHELRTPLTIVQGHLELLSVDDPRDVQETRALVLDELERMTRLVDDLTVLAKARRPDFVTRHPLDLGQLVDDTFDKVVPLGDRQWRIDARADVEIEGDPQRLAQALVQLVSNAVKFTSPGDVIALGSAVDHGESASEVLVWVRDTGVGIAPADSERIFERFERAGNSRAVEGTGLGLSIVSAIAEAHGGRVELSSLPGAGATFRMVLPLHRPEAAPMGGEPTVTIPRLETQP